MKPWMSLGIVACVLAAGGCARSGPKGLEMCAPAWRQSLQMGRLCAQAVVTRYDPCGPTRVDIQQHEIDFREGSIQAVAERPRGQLVMSASGDDIVRAQPGSMRWALATLAHRVRAGANLLDSEEPISTQRVNIEGQDLLRIAVEPNERDVRAYYVEPSTGRVRYVTAGGDKPGEVGSVTAYDYVELPGRGCFPSRIRITCIGRYVLVGDQRVLEVEYLQIMPAG